MRWSRWLRNGTLTDVRPAPIRGKGQAPTPARTGNYLGTTTAISSRDPGTCQHCGETKYTIAKTNNTATEKITREFSTCSHVVLGPLSRSRRPSRPPPGPRTSATSRDRRTAPTSRNPTLHNLSSRRARRSCTSSTPTECIVLWWYCLHHAQCVGNTPLAHS